MSQSPSSAAAMGIGNVLNSKGGMSVQGMKPDPQILQPLPQLTMERAGSPHGSEHSRYSGPMNTSYPSPTAMSAALPLPQMTTANLAAAPMGLPLPPPNMVPGMSHSAVYNPPKAPHQPPKAYPCSTCGKGFARRSDLARHERIHSGVRPHVCDHPGCGKQFIQRSALTVHTRVHTGEKPHLCERCGKPFSDSSSLARHRRIHSGKRPYKCPYADCQKTFTRRTTLTRHQNHHTGTLEDAARATAEALARGASAAAARAKTRSEGDQTSNHGSPLSTPSPAHRNLSMSPSVELSNINSMQYMSNSSLPVHLRDVHAASPASTTSSGFNSGVRPTSHPTGYGPPQTLEPSIEHHQGPGSAVGSPHMGSTGWPSPSQPVASPTHSATGSAYNYPDPAEYSASVGQMGQLFSYGAQPQMRRPGSSDPGSASYEKTRPGELWAGAQ
ncbi:hypothetical protein GQ53DRAFT_638321 [Thozetella sp. PMI_491]|nr:hypothetical protein GQ53DRAFT_638321 [Thozetella sp. PMI_491]